MYISVVLLLKMKCKTKLEIDLCEDFMLSSFTNQTPWSTYHVNTFWIKKAYKNNFFLFRY